MVPGDRTRGAVDERFWAKVDRSAGPEGCWPWTAYRDPLGYGFFRISTRQNMWKAHRVAWLLTHGERPAKLVCHRCDNPPCCNPTHLFLGTNADNRTDAKVKGRIPRGLVSHAGEMTPTAKLTAAQVEEIRTRYAAGGVSQATLGRHFDVSQTEVGRIVRGVRWKA